MSATIPNASQFADWIAEIHHQPCHVVYTNYRPTPLQHYIFPQGGDGLHLVVDEKGKFRESNFQKAMATLQSGSVDSAIAESMLDSGNGKKRGRDKGGKKKAGPMAGLHKIVQLIMHRNLDPVIVFSFSKKDCEKFALALHDEDYTDEVEKDLISQVYKNAIESLGENDRKLPQVEALLPLLKRGIGIHHGGLLPILKEIVEILFSEGLIKTLFATETFSIGINMPAKTVCGAQVEGRALGASSLLCVLLNPSFFAGCVYEHQKVGRKGLSLGYVWRVHSDEWSCWSSWERRPWHCHTNVG